MCKQPAVSRYCIDFHCYEQGRSFCFGGMKTGGYEEKKREKKRKKETGKVLL